MIPNSAATVSGEPPMLLELDRVDAGYARRRILDGVCLTAEAGRITVILGPNGAGKSTVLRAVHGLCTVTAGDSPSLLPNQT